jgi:hypothetical protein
MKRTKVSYLLCKRDDVKVEEAYFALEPKLGRVRCGATLFKGKIHFKEQFLILSI